MIERRFEVEAGLERCWDHLARVASWPTWARHIRSIDVTPDGPLCLETEGLIRLRNGVRSRFRMSELNPGSNWVWVGGFLWLRVRYDHAFEELSSGRTRIRFVVEVSGLGTSVLGRLFAIVYERSLDRAIPNLIEELER